MQNSAINYLYDTVEKYPDESFAADGKRQISFAELFLHATTISDEIQRNGHRNQPVMVYLPKGIDTLCAFAGILMSGNCYAPVDIRLPDVKIKLIAENLSCCTIITQTKYHNKLIQMGFVPEIILCLENLPPVKNDPLLTARIKTARQATAGVIDTDPCYIMYTSGSTGIPKGVVIPHRGVCDYIDWAIDLLKVDHTDIIGNQAPIFFDNSTLDLYLSWATGARLILIPESIFLFPSKILTFLETHRITFIFFVPSILTNIALLKLLTPVRLPELKKIIFAGEVMPAKHLNYWLKNFKEKMFVNLYGPTEITVDCTYYIVEHELAPEERLPIGFACRNTNILILNEDNLEAPIGQHGELCVRGSSLALGYWRDPERTSQVFVQNPLHNNYTDPIYRTGDIVYRDDQGRVIFIGRKDHQIKHMGYRIELGEIESAAMNIEGINNCCALYCKKNKEIVLCYEAFNKIIIADLRNCLARHLPSYMIPKKWNYFAKMPLTSNGKIDRKHLEKELLNN